MGEAQSQEGGPWTPGGRVGRYRVHHRLARGGMAELFVASADTSSGRTVVLKRIHPHLCDRADFRKMFLREARIAASLRHPNIVRVLDMGTQGDELYLVMEHLQGLELGAVLRAFRRHGRSIGTDCAIAIAAEVARGLAYAHSYSDGSGTRLGIVHRDVSPSNLFVTRAGGVKVLDFGIAKATNATQITGVGERKGKGAYMAPEQVTGGQVDQRTDVFALGLVLYELSTMTRAYNGDNELAVMHSIISRDIDSPSSRVADYPPALEAVVLKATERDINKRWDDAGQFAAVLEQLATSEGVTRSAAELARMLEEAELLRTMPSPTNQNTAPPPPQFGSDAGLSPPQFGTSDRSDGSLLLPTPTTMESLLDEDSEAIAVLEETVADLPEPTTEVAHEVVRDVASTPTAPLEGTPGTIILPARSRTALWVILPLAVVALAFSGWAFVDSFNAAQAPPAPAAEPDSSKPVPAPAPAAAALPQPSEPEPDTAQPLEPDDLLRRVNSEPTAKALSYEERHEIIRELSATPAGERIDLKLQLFLDALQAAQSATPCATYRSAIASLQASGNAAFLARARKESVPPTKPGPQESAAACEGLQPGPEAEKPPKTQPRGRRSSRPKRPAKSSNNRPAPAPEPAPPPAKKPQPQKPKPKPSTDPERGKLDDELRPFG